MLALFMVSLAAQREIQYMYRWVCNFHCVFARFICQVSMASVCPPPKGVGVAVYLL